MPSSMPERLNSDDGSLSNCDQKHALSGSQALSHHYFHPCNPAIPTGHTTVSPSTVNDAASPRPSTILDPPYLDQVAAPQPPTSTTTRALCPVALQKAILIPQTLPTSDSPFIRAYASSLAAHDITPIDFLTCIDHLNICLQPSPPLQVFDIAGSALGFVLEPHFQIAGAVTGATSNVAIYGVTKMRMSRYVARVNEEFFHSRGLHVRVIKGKEIGDAVPGLTSPDGKAAEDRMEYREGITKKLAPHVADLVHEDLPGNGKQKTTLDKVAAEVMPMEQKEKDKEALKKQKERDKKAEKVEQKVSELEEQRTRYQTRVDSLEAEITALESAGKDGGETSKATKKKKEEMREQEKKRGRAEKDLEKLRDQDDEKKAKRLGKVEKKFDEVLFILVEGLEQSRKREGMVSRMPT
ncbi:hypothetical protein BDZ85DRAFT_248563 [Elsinoe ampelina]|uniref:Uncharacterized protein n=1 Tax=Elsinoe ampelina TaxID=302913 RepID=A0A6A6GHH5_9PEZI|nr:hypothetical protein BDZ85DRAFT_248563 [Elsinoe ampelina]